jgi:hypothetical protein
LGTVKTFVLALLGGVAAVACHPPPAATSNPYASAAIDCRSAATLLRRGTEATPQMAPPLWRIRACPEPAGGLLGALLDTSRLVADTAELERRTWLTQYVHDARILDAALRLAADETAQPPARVAAMRTLIWMKSPGMFLTMTMMFGTPGCVPRECESSVEGHYYGPYTRPDSTSGWPVFGQPAATGYAARIDSVVRAIVEDPATPANVRSAAQLVVRFPMAERLMRLIEARTPPHGA